MNKLIIFVFILISKYCLSQQPYGFLDKSGKVVIPAIYEEVQDFNEDLAIVKYEGKWGVINKIGKVIVAFQYQNISNFNEGLATAFKDTGWQIIDKTGKVILSPKYDFVGKFNNGLAVVSTEKKYGVINKQGKVIVPLSTYEYISGYNSTVSFISKRITVGMNKAQRFSLINNLGKELESTKKLNISNKYDFKNGFAPIEIKEKDNTTSWSIINTSGVIISKIKYKSMEPFFDNLSFATNMLNKEVVIDNKGLILFELPENYMGTQKFSEGLATMYSNEGTYINKLGKEISKKRYFVANEFHEGLARVMETSKDIKTYFINKKEEKVFELDDTYDVVGYFFNDRCMFNKKEK